MLQLHPAAAVFPLLGEHELRALADSIVSTGLQHPVTVMSDAGQWVLLDGRNRIQACALAGVEVRHEVYGGEDPVGFIVAANLRRRQLNESQLSIVGVAIEEIYAAEAKKRQQETASDRGAQGGRGKQKLGGTSATKLSETNKARAKAAEQVGVSARQIQKAKAVVKRAAPEVVEAVRAGTVSVNDAVHVLDMAVGDQRACLTVVQGRGATTLARAARIVHLPTKIDSSEATPQTSRADRGRRLEEIARLHRMGLGTTEISKTMGLPLSTVADGKLALGISEACAPVKLWNDIEHVATSLSGAHQQIARLADAVQEATTFNASLKEISSCISRLNEATTAIRRLTSELKKKASK